MKIVPRQKTRKLTSRQAIKIANRDGYLRYPFWSSGSGYEVPVGDRIYIVDAGDPATLYGYGTWQYIATGTFTYTP